MSRKMERAKEIRIYKGQRVVLFVWCSEGYRDASGLLSFAGDMEIGLLAWQFYGVSAWNWLRVSERVHARIRFGHCSGLKEGGNGDVG